MCVCIILCLVCIILCLHNGTIKDIIMQWKTLKVSVTV